MGTGNSRLYGTTAGGKMKGFPYFVVETSLSIETCIKKFIRGELTWNYLKSLLGQSEYSLKKEKYPYSIVVEVTNLQYQFLLLSSDKITLSDFRDWVSVVWSSEIFYFTLYERRNFLKCLQRLFSVLNNELFSIEVIRKILKQYGVI